MANFDNIIQEINTNLPDNNTQAITAAKLRTTMIDLTNQIDTVQDDFETEVNQAIDDFEAEVNQAIAEIDPVFATNQSINNVSIVNNLTSGGINDVLSAEQGKVIGDAFFDKNYNFTQINLTTDFSVLNYYYIGSNGISYGAGANNYKIYYKQFSTATLIKYVFNSTPQNVRIGVSSETPGLGKSCTIIASSGTDIIEVEAGKYLWVGDYNDLGVISIYTVEELPSTPKDFIDRDEVDETPIQNSTNVVESGGVYDAIETAVQPFQNVKSLIDLQSIEKDRFFSDDKFSPMLIDWMQCVHRWSGVNSINVLNVISSTSSTIQLSDSDASLFVGTGSGDGACPVAVRYSNGDCKVVFLMPYDNNGNGIINKAVYEDADLTGVEYVQSVHDTLVNGQGIHLSQLGFIALAQYTANELMTNHIYKSYNLINGISFILNGDTYDSTNGIITNPNGNVVAKVNNNGLVSGVQAGDGSLAFYTKRQDNNYYIYSNGWSRDAFGIHQPANKQGSYIEFEMPANGQGFVEIQGACLKLNDFQTGTINIELYVDGVLTGNPMASRFTQELHRFDNVKAKEKIAVRFVLATNNITNYCIYGINFWRKASNISPIPLDGKRIAVLGDSWTQFPATNNGISLYEDYNSRVIRPDESQGDGFGYFTKELATSTGAVVDNWGHSNNRADTWGMQKIDQILDYYVEETATPSANGTIRKYYDYLILEFFINDTNAGIPNTEWLKTITTICKRCISRGVKPILIAPCINNSGNYRYQSYYSLVWRGLDLQ